MTLPTRWKLACTLVAAELYAMADRAVAGFYDDFLSPLDMPISTLCADLRQIGTPDAMALRDRAMKGEFDATSEEADAWALSQDAQDIFAAILRKRDS